MILLLLALISALPFQSISSPHPVPFFVTTDAQNIPNLIGNGHGDLDINLLSNGLSPNVNGKEISTPTLVGDLSATIYDTYELSTSRATPSSGPKRKASY